MNNEQFEHILRAAGSRAELSAEERKRMRSILRDYTEYKPIRREAPATLPFYSGLQVFWATVSSHSTVSFAIALIVLAVSTSGGVAYASEGALPGDALYPVKVRVVESLQTSLTVSAKAKSAWLRTLAERRLNEALVLADQGRLSTTIENELAAEFAHHANAATQTSSEEAITEAGGVSAADFAARLGAYESVITHLAKTKQRETTGALELAIAAQIAQTSTSTPPENVHSGDEPRVAHFKKAADDALDTSSSLLGSVKRDLSTTTSQQAEQVLKEAKDLRAAGDDLLKKHDDEGATKAFKKSLDATARFDVLTRTAASLHINTFSTMTTATLSAPTTSATSTPPNKQSDPKLRGD